MATIILGIDPGSRNTGFAVIKEENGTITALEYDVLRMASIDDHAERLEEIYEKVSEIIKTHNPTLCAIETPVYGVDPLAMLKLGRAQAAAMLAIQRSGLQPVEYLPKVVKKAITGNGNAAKGQVAFMLKKMMNLPDEKISEDATDALAVAWCHWMKGQNQWGKSGKKTHQNNKKSDWASFVADNPDRVKGA